MASKLSKEEQKEKYRKLGFVSYTPVALKKKPKNKGSKISYKPVNDNKYKLGPLDKLLRVDCPPKQGSKKMRESGPYTLNSFLRSGIYSGQLVSEVYLKDKSYLQFWAKQEPHKFNSELLQSLNK